MVSVQNAEGFRKRALEGAKVITYLQEFANVGGLSDLPALFRDDNRLAEAAVWASHPMLIGILSDSTASGNDWHSTGRLPVSRQ